MGTPAHTWLSVLQFLTKNSMTPVPHPPYSPNIAPSDFYFWFPLEEKAFVYNLVGFRGWRTYTKEINYLMDFGCLVVRPECCGTGMQGMSLEGYIFIM